MRKKIQSINEGFKVPKPIDGHKPTGMWVGDYIKILDDTVRVSLEKILTPKGYYKCAESLASFVYYLPIDPNTGKQITHITENPEHFDIRYAIKRNSILVLHEGENIPNDIEGFKEMFEKLVDNLGFEDLVYLVSDREEWWIGKIEDAKKDVDDEEMFDKISKIMAKRGIKTQKLKGGLQVTKIPV